MIAAPLSHGSNPNSNMAGRRREDDENLVLSFDAEQCYHTQAELDRLWQGVGREAVTDVGERHGGL